MIVRKRYTIQDMQDLAMQHGGKCLSAEYINSRTPLQWECDKEHTWFAISEHIQMRGSWCPVCARKRKLTLKEMKLLAKKRGGKCLSAAYINNRTPLQWQCEKNHIWNAMPLSIKAGSWCPVCARTNT